MTYEIKENAYGHLKRLKWIIKKLSKEESICEIGCGTGAMIVLPLALKGYKIAGIDTDEVSIQFGRELFLREGVIPKLFTNGNFLAPSEKFDTVIISEVLEHLRDDEYPQIFQFVRSKLKKGGKLLVTVPNGYGWFELESYLYFKKNIGKILDQLKITYRLDRIKNILLKTTDWVNTTPSTLCHTPHVQKFTHRSIQRLLNKHNFQVSEITGSVIFAGPFSDRLFTGFKPIMKLNNLIGSWFSRIASGFYIECRMKDENE